MPKVKSKNSDQSYFQRLKFDPMLSQGLVANYLKNFRIVILLILSISLLGFFSYLNLPKRLNPEVQIPIVNVVTILPGASPEDVESLVTIPLENELRNAKGLDDMTSISRNNVSVITMQFDSSIEPKDARDESQELVDGVTELPEDVKTPQVNALDFEDQPIWTFTVTSQTDERSLMAFSQELEKQIENLSLIDRVTTSGFIEQEVVVKLDQARVNQYGINPIKLAQAVQKSVTSYPAGEVKTENNTFSVTIDPSVETVNDLRNIKLNVQGQAMQLGDIATIVEQPKAEQGVSFLATKDAAASRAVTVYVFKASSASIDQAGRQVHTAVESILDKYHHNFRLTTIENTSEQIEEQFSDLLGEFRTTIILVFACLFIFLGLRQALISSLTVPLTFLSAFIFMGVFGMSINFISLFAFLLALGLLVDDTIVVVSAMTSYYKTGKFTVLETGLLVWRDTIVPIWSTTITTIWSFVPLLLSSGIIGEFIKPIPIVVTITMISSTAIAVLITLPIMMIILNPQIPQRVVVFAKLLALGLTLFVLSKILEGNPLLPLIVVGFGTWVWFINRNRHELWSSIVSAWNRLPFSKKVNELSHRYANHGLIDLEVMGEAYRTMIKRIIVNKSSRIKIIAAIVIYAVVSFSLLPLGLVKSEFFPKEDNETFYINVEYPSGTTLEITQTQSLKLLDELKNIDESQFVVAEIGKGLSANGGREDSQNSALFSVHLPPKEDRKLSSIAIAQDVRNQLKSYQLGRVSITEVSGGPPVGADVQLTLLGDDLVVLAAEAEKIVAYLKTQPGLTNIDMSYKTGTTQLVFVPDQTKLTEAGLSTDMLGLWLRTYASGFTLDSLNFDKTQPTDKQDVVLKLGATDPTGLSNLTLTTLQGSSYPLASLGHWETKPNPTQIVREDSKRSVTISATSMVGFSATEQNQALLKFTETIKLPEGYNWKTGGVNEENQKSQNSILQAMILSTILILVTMVVQFGSFRQAFIVLIVIPLAVSSVFLVFALTGTPLSFPALIGVLSLFGIVVTNSMFIVDKINLNQKENMPLVDAIADAGASRLEPIILTKLCTILGLLPITIADPLWRGLGGAIISGILISSTIMLLFIPSLYYSFYSSDSKRVTKK